MVAERRLDCVSVEFSGAFLVYAIRPDGSDLTQITNAGVNQFPAWSPDGTRLAVRRDVDIYVIDVTGDPLRAAHDDRRCRRD